MWLSRVTIQNFRKATSGKPLTLELGEGLNLIVGENNIGKTCAIEAIVLALSYGNIDRNLFIKEEDFNDPKEAIKIFLEFDGLTTPQQAAFLQALKLEDGKTPKAVFEFQFELKENKVNYKISCGENLETSNPIELLRYLNVMYLPALRDANQEFKPGYKSRVGKILRSRFLEEDRAGLASIFNDANTTALNYKGTENPVTKLTGAANKSIDELSLYGTKNNIQLKFVEQEFHKIIANIAMKTEGGLDINTNGLGYNNLIYIATILTDLKYEDEQEPHSFNCLLIEEPEAHLHPQLQTLLLEFIQSNYPSIQVILSSHSPTLVAATDFNKLSVLSPGANGVINQHVGNTSISEDHKIFLQRFLDVTKSQLFFARNIIFAEGITESLLIEPFWNSHFTQPADKFARQSIEIVNINGVAFEPYTALVKGIFSESKVRCLILTDDDRGSGRDCLEEFRFKDADGHIKDSADILPIFDTAPISARATKIKGIVEGLIAEGLTNISISLARKTFEIEFALANSTNPRMLEELAGLTTNSLDGKEPMIAAIEFWKEIVRKDIKTEVATKITKLLINKSPVVVPAHLLVAFEFLHPTTINEPDDRTT